MKINIIIWFINVLCLFDLIKGLPYFNEYSNRNFYRKHRHPRTQTGLNPPFDRPFPIAVLASG